MQNANTNITPAIADANTTTGVVNIDAAAREYLDRRARRTNPAGHFDGGGRWYPADDEERGCCAYIRSPSRSYPYSAMSHCRSAEHVAELFDVDATLLRCRARQIVKNGGA